MIHVSLALALLAGVAQADPAGAVPAAKSVQEDPIPVERRPQEQDLERMRPGFDPLHVVPPRPLDGGPLRVSSNSLFHNLFGFLPLEPAGTIEEGRLDVEIRQDYSTGEIEVLTPDYLFRYDATLMETNLVARLGLAGDWEAAVAIDVSNLLENEGDIILTRQGRLLVGEGNRGTGVGDLRLSTKKRLFSLGGEGALGAILGLKIPLSSGEENLLSSGGVDLAASLLYSHELGPLSLHLNLGAIVPGDIESFEEDVETRNAFTFGVAASYGFAPWGALVGQIQGNQSVFTDSLSSIAVLDETVITGHVGGRIRAGSWFLEASLGSGFNDQSSDTIFTLSLSLPF